jgi:sterol desaturase/sphingolipid hydroxylase (fatty acid hydroxylase superfamily)
MISTVMEIREGTLRSTAAYITWPIVMIASLAAAWWGFANHIDTVVWAFVVSTGTFLLILGLEHVLPNVRGWTLFRDRQSFNDIGHGILVGGLSRPIATPVAVAVLGLVVAVDDDARARGPWPHTWPMPAQVALALLLWSFTNYWTHRWFHRVERLWWFHALHHDPTRMQLLKGNRIHIAEDLLRYLVMLAPLLMLGASERVVLWIAMWNNVEGTLAHSNVDMRFPPVLHWLLPTPHNHRVHHAAASELHDANFGGITPVWDQIFGTFRHPTRHPVTEFGLGDGSTAPDGFIAQLALPFRRRPEQQLTPAPG